LNQPSIRTDLGIASHDRQRAAEIYDEAFGAKLGIAIHNPEHRLALLRNGMRISSAIVALEGEYLVGLAGFCTKEHSFTGGISYRSILKEVGFFKGQKAAFVLGLFERKAQEHELLMDGIAVSEDYRGKGVGTALFKALIEYAKNNHYQRIRLDVIDTNPDARRLYERLGFSAERTNTFEVLRPLLGFGAATTMVYELE